MSRYLAAGRSSRPHGLGIVDLVFGEIELPGDDVDWLSALRVRAVSTVKSSPATPGRWAAWSRGCSLARPTCTTTTRCWVSCSGRASPAPWRPTPYSFLDAYIYGFALQESNTRVNTPETSSEVTSDVLEQMAGGEYPHMQRVGRDLMISGFEFGSEFEFGLDLILGAIEQLPKT